MVDKDDLSSAIKDDLNKQIDTSKQKISSDDVLTDANISVQDQSSAAILTLSISQNSTAVPLIDTDAIKKQVAGRKEGEVRDMLGSLPGVKSVQVSFSPFWVSAVPSNPAKVYIVQQEVVEANSANP